MPTIAIRGWRKLTSPAVDGAHHSDHMLALNGARNVVARGIRHPQKTIDHPQIDEGPEGAVMGLTVSDRPRSVPVA